MEFNLKKYKSFKIKKHFKNNNLFLIASSINLHSQKWKNIEKIFCTLKLKYHKLYNTLFINVLKTSIYKNFIPVINGPLIFLYKNSNKKFYIKKFINIQPPFYLLCIKLNTKLYLLKQLKNIIFFNYYKTVLLFNTRLKILLKILYVSIYKIKQK